MVQYTGRPHRHHPHETDVWIFDYVAREVPLLIRMFANRLRSYRAIGYARDEVPLVCADTIDKPTVEDAEGALRHREEAT